MTIEETDTEIGKQCQCDHCDMLFVSIEEVNTHVSASHV